VLKTFLLWGRKASPAEGPQHPLTRHCLTAVYFTTNYTRWTSLSECSTSLLQPPTGVSGIKHRRTPTAFQCPMLPIAVRQLRSASRHQLTVPRFRCSTFRCRSFSSAGPQSGIHCLTICAIQLLDQTIPRNLKTHLFECC